MKVLTVRQPWAAAIIHGGKDVENRTRNLAGSYRGPVAIHAGLAYDEDALIWASGRPLVVDEDGTHREPRGATIPTELSEAITVWALDFDPEFECEVILESGEVCCAPADWLVSCVVCDNPKFECDPCLKFIQIADCDDFHCDRCHTHRRTLADLVRVEALK